MIASVEDSLGVPSPEEMALKEAEGGGMDKETCRLADGEGVCVYTVAVLGCNGVRQKSRSTISPLMTWSQSERSHTPMMMNCRPLTGRTDLKPGASSRRRETLELCLDSSVGLQLPSKPL